jgi:hypothetical protein
LLSSGTTVSPMAPPPSSSSSSSSSPFPSAEAVLGKNVLDRLGLSETQVLQTQSRIMLLWQYTRGRILVLSLICLFLGLVLPLARSSFTQWVAPGSTPSFE